MSSARRAASPSTSGHSASPRHALAAARVPHHFVSRPGVGSFRFTALMFEADALLHLQRHEEFLQVLRAALETGRRGGFLNVNIPLPAITARLCAAAFKAGSKTDYVERLIRARRLLPPAPQTAHWPWPVRIRALGGFSVSIDGVPLTSEGKTQRRTISEQRLCRGRHARPGRADGGCDGRTAQPISDMREALTQQLRSTACWTRPSSTGRVSSVAANACATLAHIDQLIEEGGKITVGQIYPIGCEAIASDSHNSLAMLRRRPGETVPQLLERLDAAIALAWNDDRFTDEINPPTSSRRP